MGMLEVPIRSFYSKECCCSAAVDESMYGTQNDKTSFRIKLLVNIADREQALDTRHLPDIIAIFFRL